MIENVVRFTGITKLDTSPDLILQSAIDAGVTEVVVVGLDRDGNFYFASSQADAAEVTWHLERAKWRLMQTVDDLEAGE